MKNFKDSMSVFMVKKRANSTIHNRHKISQRMKKETREELFV